MKKVKTVISLGILLISLLTVFPQATNYVTTLDQAILELASAEDEFSAVTENAALPYIEAMAAL